MGRYLDLCSTIEVDAIKPAYPGDISDISDQSLMGGVVDSPRPPLDAEGLPIDECPACGHRSFWRWPQSSPHFHSHDWRCIRCTPIPSDAGPCDACALPPA